MRVKEILTSIPMRMQVSQQQFPFEEIEITPALIAQRRTECENAGGTFRVTTTAAGKTELTCTYIAEGLRAVEGQGKFPKWAWWTIGGGVGIVTLVLILRLKRRPQPTLGY